ncbi:seizure protein 6 homolog isoform X2 [Dromaius novaehollandiae]|uniref:seizure protein 6 homolog isoform X2 n=1 Tax=Dromaius novaehollandiae TaxID=8790 RepID=UPI00311DDDF1
MGSPPPPALLLLPLLAALLRAPAHGFNGLEAKAGASAEAEGEPTALPTAAEREAEARFVTTAPTLKLLNHHPLLEDLLHEAFLKKDDLAQAPARPPARTPVPPFAADPLTTAAGRRGPWAEPRAATDPTEPAAGPTPTVPGTSPGPPAAPSPWGATEETTTTAPTQGPGEQRGATGPPPAPAPCNQSLAGPEGSLASPEPADLPHAGGLDCTYTISVYPGYGVELQVQNISLAEGETLTVESAGGLEPAVLANESFLQRGQVIRSPANLVTLRFQSPQPARPGSYRFRFQAYLLSCPFPARPAAGDVSVTSLHPGGDARFRCAAGYQLQGARVLACRNATRPFWSAREPRCVAACGGAIRNATVGRVVSPGFPGNYSNNLTCHWLLEAPAGHRLHLHFEKVSLAEDDDRLIIRNGNNVEAPPVYDSYEVEYLPIEGLLSTGRHFFVELTTDSSGASTGMALRYEAFEHGHCYEPFVKYGNFTASDARYPVGTTVEFSCDPGYTLEQGSTIIECVDPGDPQWNETEPACRAVCSGEITDAAGVVLSPNWPEAYGKGQDCIWGLHVEEDKRVMLDVRVLRVGRGDVLTFYDGDDLTARILGQYTGARGRFKLYASTADVTIQFQSDPGAGVFGYQQGFVIHFYEVPRNDTCPELPEIPNGWKTTSHPELVHGTVVTYHCYPGFELAGTDVLMCHWDLTWSGDLPACERVTSCGDPGDAEHGRRVVSSAKFPVGATVQFVCNKGYVLTGAGLLTCHDRPAAGPKWSDRVPKCIPEAYEPCRNPGAPAHGLQSPERRLYPAGAALRFSCAAGHVLLGEGSLRCLPGHPSRWSASPPVCKAASYDEFYSNRNLDAAAKAVPAGEPLRGPNVAVAVALPVLLLALLGGGVCLCFSRLQGKPALQLPLAASPPYDHIAVEAAFDNPGYETGDTREYEVSI